LNYLKSKEVNKEVNIEFIGIACNEQNDENWIEAIEKDKLSWAQINDAHSEKSIAKQYVIMMYPTCFLISPEGQFYTGNIRYILSQK
jgi:hypothetical protein